jgi:glycine hydroxymethyltransferase
VAFKEALQPEFTTYCREVVENARTLGETLMERGVRLVSGGTDNHLLLVDLRDRDLTGKDAEALLEAAGITVNKNTVPGEPRSPFVTSGLRIGTAALTSRGFGTAEMLRVGGWIADILEAPEDTDVHRRVRDGVSEVCSAFPLYEELVAV